MLYILIYLSAIVLANFSVLWFGPVSTPVNAFLLIGLDLTLRDKLHDRWVKDKLWLRMFLLISAGSAITYILNRNAGPIALASVVSFAAAALADAVMYSRLITKKFMIRSNGSNLAGSLLDSFLFPTLAFGTVLPWVILGQFFAKAAGGFLWSLFLKKYSSRAQVNTEF